MSTIYDFTYTLNSETAQNEAFYNSTATVAKTEYGPTSHFFADESQLSSTVATNYATDAFGPCGTVTSGLTTKYRTTSKVRASVATPVKVFAICKAQVLIQPQTEDATKVNLILKPESSYAPLKIKYFIYRGINKADLIDNGKLKTTSDDINQPKFLKKLWSQFTAYNTSLDVPPPTEFPSSLIGYDETQSDSTLIENYFSKKDISLSYQIPSCTEGEYLGNFTGEIGLDIVLDHGDYQLQNQEELFKFDLKFAREKEHIFDIATIPSSTSTKVKRYKEYIHQFMDAAAFWGSHIECGTIKTIINPTGLKANNDIFTKIVSKYQTKNKIYVYIQGENNRSYNYYDATRKVYGLSTTGQLNDTFGWPIIIDELTTTVSTPPKYDKAVAFNLDYSIHFCDGTYNMDTSVTPNVHVANIVIPEYERHVSIDIISPKNNTSLYPSIERPSSQEGFVNENILFEIPDNATISGTLPAGLHHQLIPGYIHGTPTTAGVYSLKITSNSTVQNIDFIINSTSTPIVEYLTGKTKQIDIKFQVNGTKSCASFLMMYCNLKQESPLKNYYNDLFPVNLKTNFLLPTTETENLSSWATYDKSIMINLDDVLDVAASIQNKIVFDNGKGTVASGGAIPRKERRLYMAILKRNSKNTTEYNELNITTITSGIAKTTTSREQYALNVYNDQDFSVYKGTFDDGGTIINSLVLVHSNNLNKKSSFFHLGITNEEYNKLIYGQTTIPVVTPPAIVPQFLPTDADNVYFHLEEVLAPIFSTPNVQKFKVGLRFENNTGTIETKFPLLPANDVYVYTLDGKYFFSEQYAEFQEFFEEYPQAKANFRINQPYIGEFGFDWMRVGDTTLLNGNPVPGDINYKNHLGKLYRDAAHTIFETDSNEDKGNFKPIPKMFSKLENEYKSFPIQWNTNHTVDKYYVPILNIYPPYISTVSPIIDLDRQSIFAPIYDDDINRVANLKLAIDISVVPTKIELLYDKTILEIKPATSTGPVVIPQAIGKNNLDITVKCLKEFGVEQQIKIIAFYGTSGKGKTIGILRVKPNLKINRFSKKLLLVDVITNLTGTIRPLNFSIKQHAENLKMFLRQISITPILDTEKIDLVTTTDTFFNSNYVYTHPTGRKFILGYDEGRPILDDVVKYLYTKLKGQTIAGSSSLIGTKYDDYFKIFFFHDTGGYMDSTGNFGTLSGYSNRKDKLVDFPNIYPSTSTHEFLHTARVPHSFTAYEASKFAKFTYEPWVTDNIMDYSDINSTTSTSVGLPTISLYDWQGNIAHQYVNPEP